MCEAREVVVGPKGPFYFVCIYSMFAEQWSVLTGAAVCVRELLFPSKNPPWHCRSRHLMLCRCLNKLDVLTPSLLCSRSRIKNCCVRSLVQAYS